LGQAEALYEDCWLSPIQVGGQLLTTDSLTVASASPIVIIDPSPEAVAKDVDKHTNSLDAVADTTPTNGPAEDVPADDVAAEEQPDSETSADEAPSDRNPEESDESRLARRRQWLRRRASDAPILDITWQEYDRVLRQLIQRKFGKQPPDAEAADGSLEETLTGWGINAEAWLAEFEQFERRCRRAMGAAGRMALRAADLGQLWIRGVGWCRQVFLDLEGDRDRDRGPPADDTT
jgi:hypothetical protein